MYMYVSVLFLAVITYYVIVFGVLKWVKSSRMDVLETHECIILTTVNSVWAMNGKKYLG